MMAMIGKEALKVYFECSFIVFLKAYASEQKLVVNRSAIGSVMHSAQVYKIERSASHDEQSLIVNVLKRGGKIVDYTALVGKSELTNAGKSVLNVRGIRQKICVVFNTAPDAYLLLRYLRLNG